LSPFLPLSPLLPKTPPMHALKARFSCFGPPIPDTVISSDAISSHAVDTDALTACMLAPKCHGVVYASSNSESTRWSVRTATEDTTLFPMTGTTSYIYSGTCEPEPEAETGTSPFLILSRLLASVPDDHLSVRTNSRHKWGWQDYDDR